MGLSPSAAVLFIYLLRLFRDCASIHRCLDCTGLSGCQGYPRKRDCWDYAGLHSHPIAFVSGYILILHVPYS